MARGALSYVVTALVASCASTSAPPNAPPLPATAVLAPTTPPSVAAPEPDPAPPTPPPTPSPPAEKPAVEWAVKLAPVTFRDTKSGESRSIRLYAADGSIDEAALSALDQHLFRDETDKHLDRRLCQLVVKAAAHFHAAEVLVVSSVRDGAGKNSKHRSGQAMDFSLPGVAAATLAAHLRTFARVGVGIYTHPRTQYVHLDVREQSFHWLDASPPRRHWKEKGITEPGAPARDRAWTPADDLPR